MKTLLIIGILLIGLSGQAFSMGHPHNIFAARKQLRAKASVSVVKNKLSASSCWQQSVQLPKTTLGERLLSALSHVRPVRSF
ncbi:hypothetical protein [Spirosoma sp. KNUC1025]|uniref:hypothetical protein n=1 Tax=Spirosoma sp. KNUC1025 TaxID=2894082 RepID=UPI003868BF87|nr:hypothetical protein LN737_05025 [Spirosoma sp. KNUC1025]